MVQIKKKKYLIVIMFAFLFALTAVKPAKAAKSEDEDIFEALEKVAIEESANTGSGGFAGISGIVGSVDASGNVLSVDYAIALSGGIIFSTTSAYTEGAAGYAFISVMEGQCVVKLDASDSSLGATKWSITSGAEDSTFMNVTYPYENQQATLYYIDPDGNSKSAPVVITGYNIVNDYCMLSVQANVDNSQIMDPAVICDANGSVVAMVFSGGVMAPYFDENLFYGSDGGGSGTNPEPTTTTNNNNNNNNNKSSKDDKNFFQKYWWAILIAAAAAAYFYMNSRKQTNGGYGNEDAGSAKDIALDGGPYNGGMGGSSSPANNNIGATTPYVPPVEDIAPTAPAMPVTPPPAPTPAPAAPVGPQNYKLYAVGGYMDGRVYPFDGKEITFGRDNSVSIKFPQETKGVSRIHCKLYMEGGKVMLMDLGSSYGTFIEGKGKIVAQAPVELKPGDKFCIGEQKNSFILKL